MSDSAWFGLALLVYILMIVPKFLMETGDISSPNHDDQPYMRLSSAWIAGLLVLFGLNYVQVHAVPSFFVALFVFGGIYYLIRNKKV